MHGIAEGRKVLIEIKKALSGIGSHKQSILGVGPGEIMVDHGSGMVGRQWTDQEHLISFVVKVEGQCEPETAGSLNFSWKRAGYDRHGSQNRVMEIFVSRRQDRAFGLFNPPTYRESAYLLCGTTPPSLYLIQYRYR